MDTLKNKFAQKNKFEDMARALMSRETITISKNLLSQYNISDNISPKDLLSCFMIFKFPAETIGAKDVAHYQDLIKSSVYLVESTPSNFKERLLSYINQFRSWKEDDKNRLINDIFQRYHQLTVDIMNAPEDAKAELERCKNELLRQAYLLGKQELVDKILSYSPVIINTEELQKQYDKAFWDLFSEEYNNKKYDRLFELLSHLKKLYITLAPSKEQLLNDIIDVDFIKQRIENNAYTNQELLLLVNNIFDVIKSLQAPVNDERLEEFRNQINVDNLHFPTILKHIVELTRHIIISLENLKRD